MPRYFLADQLTEDGFTVAGEEARHLTRVLRKAEGDRVTLADGKGRFYQGIITRMLSEAVEGRITAVIEQMVEATTRILLCQALPKGDKMDEIIRKGTEIGVAGFLPFLSERCVARPDAAAIRKRQERWQRIAEEASKQAGRSEIPQVYGLSDWEGVRAACAGRFTILAYEAETKQGLAQVLQGQAPEQVAIVIGPEGGFAPTEVQAAVAAGMHPVSLGPRILRTQTAGPVLAALVLYELGDM